VPVAGLVLLFPACPWVDGAALRDRDGDGHLAPAFGGDDCDDDDARVGAPSVESYADADGDGLGDPATFAVACDAAGRVDNGDDCDDTDPALPALRFDDADGDGFFRYVQYETLKKVNPRALDPALAIILEILFWSVSGGIGYVFVQWHQAKKLEEAGTEANTPGRNVDLVTFVTGAAIASVLSAWLSFTVILSLGIFAAQIYALVLFQRELELHTDPA
jgi:hypothetical protein